LVGEGMKFWQLIVRKIIKIVATRYQILRLKSIKIDFGWSSAPNPVWGIYSASRCPSAGIKGTYFQGKGKGAGRGRGEQAGRGEGRG